MTSNPGKILTTLTRRATGITAHLTISCPSKLNALNTHLLDSLPTTLKTITTQNADLLAVVLTGAGPKAFVGGADIAEMAALDSPASARAFISKVSAACTALRDCPVPVIGRINGYALGAGCELAAACDVRVAGRNAVFGMPEVRLPSPRFIHISFPVDTIYVDFFLSLRVSANGNRFGLESLASWKQPSSPG